MHRDFSSLLSMAAFQAPDSAPGGGTASSPASTASETPPAPATASPSPSPSSESGSSDFGELGGLDDFESVEIPGTPSGEDPATSSQDPTASAAPEPAPKATPAPAAPATPAAEPSAPATPASGGGPPPSELDSLLQTLEADSGKQMVDWLAANAYKLTKEESEELETNAVGVIPRLMAKVQVQAMRNSLNLFKTLLPKIISEQVQSATARSNKAREALDEFYATNKDLNAKDHAALVGKWSKVFRAQNPSASRQDAIKFVGNAIRAEMGLPPLAASSTPAAKTAPFAPARPGARAPVASTVVEESPFMGLGQDFDGN